MKKTLIVIGLITSLLMGASESVTFKRADDNRNDRSNYNNNDDRNRDQVKVDGYITYIRDWRDYSVIEIKQRNGGVIKGKVELNRYMINDIVNGTCVNYKGGEYERCSLYRR